MTIEQALTEAAREGRFTLNLFAASEGYQASLSHDRRSWRVEMGADPVEAIEKVLGLRPGASGPMRETDRFAGVFD